MAAESRTSSIQAQNASAESSFVSTPPSVVQLSAASYRHYGWPSSINGGTSTSTDNSFQFVPQHTENRDTYFYPGQFDTTTNYAQPYKSELGDEDLYCANGSAASSGTLDIMFPQNNFVCKPHTTREAHTRGHNTRNTRVTTNVMNQWPTEDSSLQKATAGVRHKDSRRQHEKKLRITMDDVDKKLRQEKR